MYCWDINAFTTMEERQSSRSQFRRQEMIDFVDFIFEMELIDIPLSNKRFT